MKHSVDYNKQVDEAKGLLQQDWRSKDPPPVHPMLQMQRLSGNQEVQTMLRNRVDVAAGSVRLGSRCGNHCSPAGAVAGAQVEASIERKRGGGQPLDATLRAQMDPAFGFDFSGVRVHNDAEAGSLNRALGAKAFTTGQDLFFSPGAYNPGTHAGRELVAHELTHVVQQRGRKVQTGMILGEPGDRYEREAVAVARQVANMHSGAVLQRRCACGGESASGGECASCRENRQAGVPGESLHPVPSSLLQPSLQVSESTGPQTAAILRESDHPEEQHCQELSQDSTASCAAIIECINDLIEQLAGRFSDIDNLGGDEGHRQRIRIVQLILRTLMTIAAFACKNGEYDKELEEEAEKWANKPLQTQAQPKADPEPSFREKIAEALKKAGVPAWVVAALVVLVIAALADPEPFSKVALLIGAAAAILFFVTIGRQADVPPGA